MEKVRATSKALQEQILLQMQSTMAPIPLTTKSLDKAAASASANPNPWSGQITGPAGLLMLMAFQEAAIQQEISRISAQQGVDTVKAYSTFMMNSANEQETATQKDAQSMTLDAIQAGVSAGIGVVQGAATIGVTHYGKDVVEAEDNLNRAKTTDDALTKRAKTIQAGGRELEDMDPDALKATKARSTAALEDVQKNQFKTDAEREAAIGKLNDEDLKTAQAAIKSQRTAAQNHLDAESQKAVGNREVVGVFGQLSTQLTTMGTSLKKSAVTSDKAINQAESTKDGAYASMMDRASQTALSQSQTSQSQCIQMLQQILSSIQQATRA